MMRRILVLLTVVAMMVAMLAANAMPAFAQGVGPGNCIPPGYGFSVTAKLPGPNTYGGLPPGQYVKEHCL